MSVRDLPHHLAVFCTVFWVGGTWGIGYLAVPSLFHSLADRQLAGMLAGNMFTAMAFAGVVCALYLLAYRYYQTGRAAWKQRSFILTLSMLILLAIGQFGIQPVMAELKVQALPLDVMQSALAAQFKMLHGAASILYLIQSLLGLVLVAGLSPAKSSGQ